jgi:hypothetical protein
MSMGKRKALTEKEWMEELEYIETTYIDKNLSNFNNDNDCFKRYVKMQAKFAAADGYGEIAEGMKKYK